MITFDDLGSPISYEVDQKLKQKARKYQAEAVKPIKITPEQPAKQVYKEGKNES